VLAHPISKVIRPSHIEMLAVFAEEIDCPRRRVFRQHRYSNRLHLDQHFELRMQGFDVPFEAFVLESTLTPYGLKALR
jgi:hypothetical protein